MDIVIEHVEPPTDKRVHIIVELPDGYVVPTLYSEVVYKGKFWTAFGVEEIEHVDGNNHHTARLKLLLRR